ARQPASTSFPYTPLFRSGDWVSAEEARQLGMVNHVVPRADLDDATMGMARRIANRPSFALKLAKESVNQTLEAQGMYTAMRAARSEEHTSELQSRGHLVC